MGIYWWEVGERSHFVYSLRRLNTEICSALLRSESTHNFR